MIRFRTRPPRALVEEEPLPAEKAAAAFAGVQAGVLLGDAGQGWHFLLGLCGLTTGDSILCSPFAGQELLAAVQSLGITPVFADVHPGHFHINPAVAADLLGQYAREGTPKPKAVVADYLFGGPGDITALGALCALHNIPLLEDMGSSLGAGVGAVRAGSLGLARLGEDKIDWGYGSMALVQRREDEAALRRQRRNYPGSKPQWEEKSQREVQALLWEKRLPQLAEEVANRQAITARYRQSLGEVMPMQELLPNTQSACTRLAVLCPHAHSRDTIALALGARQIPTGWYHWPQEAQTPILREQIAGSRYTRPQKQQAAVTAPKWATATSHIPAATTARALCQRLLLLPIHPYLNNKTVDYICRQVLCGLA